MALELEKIKYAGEFPRQLPTQGQNWAEAINKNFTLIDEHNHEISKGEKIDSTSLASGQLDLKTYSIKKIWALDFDQILDSNVVNNTSIFVNATNDICFKNGSGDVIQITAIAGINPAYLPVGFTILDGTPLCVFDNFRNTFVFKSGTSNNPLQDILCNSGIFTYLDAREFELTGSVTLEQIYLPVAQKLCYVQDSNTDLLYKDLTHCLYKITSSNDTYATLTRNNGLYLEATGATNDVSYFKGARHFIAKDTVLQEELPLGMEYKVKDFTFDLVNNECRTQFTLEDGFSEISNDTGKLLLGVIPIFSLAEPTANFIDNGSFLDINVKNVFIKPIIFDTVLSVDNNFVFYNFPKLKITYRIVYCERFKTEV